MTVWQLIWLLIGFIVGYAGSTFLVIRYGEAVLDWIERRHD